MSLEVPTTDSDLSDEAIAALASLLLDWAEADEQEESQRGAG